jgi:pimeloyl-ACP methyl ester carboxylesterase
MATTREQRLWAAAGALAGAALAGAVAERRHDTRVAADPENQILRDPPRGRPLSARSGDGTVLHAEVFGEDATGTVVLAHGWTEELHYWTYVIRELTGRGFQVIAYDLRGHGQSHPATSGDYAIPRFAEDLEAVLRDCVPDGRRVLIAGHSLGAMSIVSWAERYELGDNVVAVALINTGLRNLLAEQLLIPIPWLARLVRGVPPRYSVGSRAPLPNFSTPLTYGLARYFAFGPAATPAQVAFYERMLITTRPDVRAKVGITLSELDLHNALPRVTVPTTVIAGADDRLTPPSHAQRIGDQLPRLHRLIVLSETGHMAPLERPAEVCDALGELARATASDPVGAPGSGTVSA